MALPIQNLILILFAVLFRNFASTLDIDTQIVWTEFKIVLEKNYQSSDEETRRFAIFEDNLATIVDHNLAEDLGWHSFRLGINHMTDLTLYEYREQYLSVLDEENVNGTRNGEFRHDKSSCVTPKSINHKKLGRVTKVRNQGRCGSCYAMAACGAVEGGWKKNTTKLVTLSPQNLIDCTNTSKYRNLKCNGGHIGTSFQYAIDYGIDSEDSYPYEAVGKDCRYRTDTVGARIRAYYYVKAGNLKLMLKAVGCVGPVAAAMHADSDEFKQYKKGIINDPKCSVRLDHAVLIIGFNRKSRRLPYWIVKNSWGRSWGEKGFFRLAISGTMCGIMRQAAFPIV